MGPDDALYGTSYWGGASNVGVVFRIETDGSAFGVLHHFGTGGSRPQAGLTLGPDGSLYGTTESGGTSSLYGTVFRIQTAARLAQPREAPK